VINFFCLSEVLWSLKKFFYIGILFFVLFTLFLSGCLNQDSGNKSSTDYNWSTMDEGPYNDKVSFATSIDLFNWTDSGRVLAEHASVPGAVYKDGVIYVYFVDVSVDGVPERIGLVRSSDNGSTWSDKEYVVFKGIGDKVPVDPAPFLLDDGRIRLYYFDINEERSSAYPGRENKIYSAVSSDGVNFVQEEGVRFSKAGIYDPDVVKVGDTWKLYVGDVSGNRVISAVSIDGLNFTEEGVAYTGGAVPDVYYEDGVYYLYTAGIDISTSKDGSSFSKTLYSFRSSHGMVTADPSVVKLENGEYIMFYKFK